MDLLHFCKNIIIKSSELCISLFRKLEKKCGYQESKTRIITNINRDPLHNQKRVLISYLDFAETGERTCRCATHTNYFELYAIIHFFIEKDYVIDVCSCSDTNAIGYAREQVYDIIFGFGAVFRALAVSSKAYKILYLTENPYHISRQREQERIDYFYKRHHIRVPLERTGRFFLEGDEKLADAMICLGSPAYVAYTGVETIRVWPSALINENIPDFSERSSKNFLVLGTEGIIHKGIDLLIEVFGRHEDWNLYLCGYNIKRELKKLKYPPLPGNIKDCGFVNVYSDSFIALVRSCTYILLPSCSEAPSTAILTGMCHGLIPIVMRGNGMDDMEEYCLYFDSYALASMEQKLSEASSCSQAACMEKASKIMEFARKNFSLENFRSESEKALSRILQNAEAKIWK